MWRRNVSLLILLNEQASFKVEMMIFKNLKVVKFTWSSKYKLDIGIVISSKIFRTLAAILI